MPFAAAHVVVAYDGHTGILAGGAGVRLQGDGLESRYLAEPFADFVNQFDVTLCLVGGSVWMDVAGFSPAQREHFGGGVQLHRAAMDVRDSYRVPFEPDEFDVLERHPGAHSHVSESRDAHHRDFQVRLPWLRRIRGLEVAHLQLRLHVGSACFGSGCIQQGAEEFYGYGVI